MESKRQQKMASLLQQELAQVLQRDLPHLFGGGLVPSISTVKVTPDLGVARIYLSLLIGNDAPERLDAIRCGWCPSLRFFTTTARPTPPTWTRY